MFLCTPYNMIAGNTKRSGIMQEDYRAELMDLAKEHQLNPEELATLTEYSRSSVDAWLMPDRTSDRARPVPGRAVSLLKAKIEAAKANLN